eukprot:6211068-Pleurochrysis_carterae.AAC.4
MLPSERRIKSPARSSTLISVADKCRTKLSPQSRVPELRQTNMCTKTRLSGYIGKWDQAMQSALCITGGAHL